VNSQPDRQWINFELRQYRYDSGIGPDKVFADKADSEPSPYRLPCNDQIVGPKCELFPRDWEASRGKTFKGLIVAVTANDMVFKQIGCMTRHATPTQVILVGTGSDCHLSYPPSNESRLLGLDHTHSNIGFSPQKVAHRIAGH
jgi:hypothetical protein